ncbi:MAG TPA: hypothetical protein DCQ45_08635 [Erysipelotrichaceae bacterium]|nr:hypothetical protein [Erysipelotrichaceae bacterium]
MKLNYHILSKYRTPLMGIAMISIICMHYFEDLTLYFSQGTIAYTIGRSVLDVVSTFGVEIFLFLSGIGLFYSWHKKHELIPFYKKRFSRVLIPYLAIGSIFFIIYYINRGFDPFKFFKGLFFITFFERGFRTFWYILCIMLCYLLFPFINHFINDSHHELRSLIRLIAATILFNTAIAIINPALFDNIEILLTRLPIFMIGVYFGKLVYEEKTISHKAILFYCLCFIGAITLRVFKTNIGLPFWGVYQRYIAALLALPTMLMFSAVLEYISNNMMQILNFFGKHSLEIFLFHMCYRYFFRAFHLPTIYFPNECLMVALSVFTATLYSYFYTKSYQRHPLRFNFSH